MKKLILVFVIITLIHQSSLAQLSNFSLGIRYGVELEHYKAALEYYGLSMQIKDSLGDVLGIANGNNNIGQYVVHALKPNTSYLVDIRGKCFTGALGTWTSKVAFTTPQASSRFLEENPFGLAAFPSPTHTNLNYTFNSEKDENYVLKVCDMSGRELLQESRKAEDGSNGAEVNVNHFPPGLYLLIVQKGAQTSHFRFAVD